MLVVRFPDGGSLSIEFTGQAPDDEHPRLGAWLELRAEDPAAVMRAALDAGLREVKHPGHPYYVMAPGGQVFTIAPLVLDECEAVAISWAGVPDPGTCRRSRP
jgi:hypothetical protein